MNLLAAVARPVFSWNHDELMREGGESLARRLGVDLAVADTPSRPHRPVGPRGGSFRVPRWRQWPCRDGAGVPRHDEPGCAGPQGPQADPRRSASQRGGQDRFMLSAAWQSRPYRDGQSPWPCVHMKRADLRFCRRESGTAHSLDSQRVSISEHEPRAACCRGHRLSHLAVRRDVRPAERWRLVRAARPSRSDGADLSGRAAIGRAMA